MQHEDFLEDSEDSYGAFPSEWRNPKRQSDELNKLDKRYLYENISEIRVRLERIEETVTSNVLERIWKWFSSMPWAAQIAWWLIFWETAFRLCGLPFVQGVIMNIIQYWQQTPKS